MKMMQVLADKIDAQGETPNATDVLELFGLMKTQMTKSNEERMGQIANDLAYIRHEIDEINIGVGLAVKSKQV